MCKIMLMSVILKLLSYHISRVESLIGENFTPIRAGELPFFASFQYFPEGINFCGGALITKKHVITLGYCLADASPASFRIVFEAAHVQELALTYTAASWTTYVDWARRQGIQYDNHVAFNLAIVTLTDKLYHVNPVPLNGLTKEQLAGTEAKMIGRSNDVLSTAIVQLLSDEDCETNFRSLRNRTSESVIDDRGLCTTADPYALLDFGDIGSPLLHARDNSLLGIAFGYGPVDGFVNSYFSTDFIRQHQINIHTSVYYYRLFIYSVIPAAPAA